MENFKSLYEILKSESLRRRPTMWIGSLSILGLRNMIDGYLYCLEIHHIEEIEIKQFHGFHDFVAKYYKRPSQAGWALNIWAENYGDEPQSLSSFFRLFDSFIGEKREDAFYHNLLLLYRGKLSQDDFIFERMAVFQDL
jgi:hypothetical protein